MYHDQCPEGAEAQPSSDSACSFAATVQVAPVLAAFARNIPQSAAKAEQDGDCPARSCGTTSSSQQTLGCSSGSSLLLAVMDSRAGPCDNRYLEAFWLWLPRPLYVSVQRSAIRGDP